MKRPSYRDAVDYIAQNDEPTEMHDLGAVRGLVTVQLVAEIFDVHDHKVSTDVLNRRHAIVAQLNREAGGSS